MIYINLSKCLELCTYKIFGECYFTKGIFCREIRCLVSFFFSNRIGSVKLKYLVHTINMCYTTMQHIMNITMNIFDELLDKSEVQGSIY